MDKFPVIRMHMVYGIMAFSPRISHGRRNARASTLVHIAQIPRVGRKATCSHVVVAAVNQILDRLVPILGIIILAKVASLPQNLRLQALRIIVRSLTLVVGRITNVEVEIAIESEVIVGPVKAGPIQLRNGEDSGKVITTGSECAPDSNSN